MKLINIQKDYELLLKDTITNYTNPSHIYIPAVKNIQIDPKNYIYKQTLIYDKTYSPVSGKIVGLKELKDIDGNLKKYIVIENDYKEKTEKKSSIRSNFDKLKKEKFLELLNDYDENIYNIFLTQTDKIVLNVAEEQPYLGNKEYIIKEYSKELLDLIDSIAQICGYNNIEILAKETDLRLINNLNNIIGSYPNMILKLIPNKYMITQKDILVKSMNMDENFIYLQLEELYDLYNYVIRKKHKENVLITITGTKISNPQVIKCKIGTLLSDLMKEYIETIDDNYVIILNSLITGINITDCNYVIDKNTRGIYIMDNIEIPEEKCIKCGKCNEICPMNINVYNLVNNKKCDLKKCIKCGMCSYICPSYININKLIDGDRNE